MIYGFMNMLYKVQDNILPDCTIIVFDAPGKTFRHKLQNDYKANRPPIPDDLRLQLPLLQELLRLCGFNVVMLDGVEADDVTASLAKLVHDEGHEAVILSSDKDLLQVLGDGIRMMRPVKNGISGAEVYDAKSFMKEYGFNPASMPDYLAITGDKADNIMGIAGIGTKGAMKLLAQYPTLEAIYASLDTFTKSMREKLQAADRDKVIWRRDSLTMLKDNLFEGKSDFLNECLNARADFKGAEEMALHLELKRVLKRLGSKQAPFPREFSPNGNAMPECVRITIDYKGEYRSRPEKFTGVETVWDIKTAYYLLHPDIAALKFAGIISNFEHSEDPLKAKNDLALSLEAEIGGYEGLLDVMNDIDVPLIPVLCKMEDHGVRINTGTFELLQEELETRISEIERHIITITGVRININSPVQVSWLLFDKLGFTPEGKTRNKASYSTEAAVLERLSKSTDGQVPALILEYRELSKMLNSFVIPLQRSADINGIIHTTFDPAMTGTGRLSSRDPNLQNIPAFGRWAEKIKSGLIPVNPENVFVSADYSQVELRVLAYMSGEEKLIESFENGRDIHTETASWVFGTAPEFVMPEMRRAAKVINFGLLYGMGSFGLAERLGVGRSEARDIMTRYFDALPGIKPYLERLIHDAKERGYTMTLAGRIRPVKEIPAKSQGLSRALVNTPIQGTAADISRRAMIDFSNSGNAELFLQVHDSLVCECPAKDAEEVSQNLRNIMIKSGGEISHLEVEVKTGKTLADV